MSDTDKISVIVPIYNVEDYLTQSLASLQQQTYQNFEVIMVNDGSKDHSEQIARQYLADPRFKIISQENRGLSAARNTGMKYVTGDYIYFFDSDDQIAPNLFEVAIENIKRFDADLVSFGKEDVNQLQAAPDLPNFKISTLHKAGAEEALTLILDNKIIHTAWSYIVKAQVLLDNNISFPVGKTFEDVYTTPKIYANTKNAVIMEGKPGPYFYLNNRSGSIMDNVKKNVNIIQFKDRAEAFASNYQYLKAMRSLPIQFLDTWYFVEMLITYNWYYSLFIGLEEPPLLESYKSKIMNFYKSHDIKMDFRLRLRFLKAKCPTIARILNLLH